jgi:hypothetical protein
MKANAPMKSVDSISVLWMHKGEEPGLSPLNPPLVDDVWE